MFGQVVLDSAPDSTLVKALRESEARLRLAAAAADLGVWDWDIETNVMIYSDRAKAIYGFPPDAEVTFEMVRAATHADDLPRTSAMARDALDTIKRAKEPYEYRIVWPDATIRWVLAHGEALFDKEGSDGRALRYVGTIQDITERKLAEQILLARETTLRLALDAGRFAVWQYDVKTETVEGSEELYRLLGFPAGIVPSLDQLREGYHPDDRGIVATAARAALEKGERFFEARYRYQVEGNSLRWLHLRGEIQLDQDTNPVGVIGLVSDITAQREFEIRQENARARLMAALDASGTGTWHWDIPTDTVSWDDALCRVYGITSEEAPKTAADFFGLVHADDREIVSRVIEAAFKEGVDPDYEFRASTPDGRVRWIYDRSKVVRDPNGRVTAIIGACLDITERKNSEQLLIQSELRLRRAHEAAHIGDFELDLITGAMVWSDNLYRLLGYDPAAFSPTDEAKFALIHPDDRARGKAEIERVIRDRTRLEFVFRARHIDGEYRWLASRGELQFDPHGKAIRLVGVNFDVTALHVAQARQKTLINELNHRVKNTLATVQSLAVQTMRNTESTIDARALFESRLTALARAHDVLTLESWEGAKLQQVADRALEPFASKNNRVSIEGPNVWLAPKQALAIAMTLHELATNAAKYGALSNNSGYVKVNWTVKCSDQLELTWTEEGGPKVLQPTRTGFGTRLIQRNLAHDLGGEATIEYRPQGVISVIRSTVKRSDQDT